MLYGIVIAIHIIVSLVLIAVILLQAGRGGGLSESFGGSSSTQTILGTKSPVFLKRMTAVAAVLYIVMCLVLGVMTGHRGRSLVAKGGVQTPMTTGGGYPQPTPDESPIAEL